jgi:hypothetical protein
MVAGLIPATPALAVCRPTTLADLPPLHPPAPAPPAEGEAAPVEPAPAPPPRRCAYVYKMNWPVLGGGRVGSVFGEARDGGARRHAGIDIVAPKLTPVVAVKAGTVVKIHDGPGDCCWLKLRHRDGWSSVYIHLNNDTAGTDDGRGYGIRPDLTLGSEVEAGEVIGWLGDSGNAETTVPHLHFELHLPSGRAMDPLASLRWAQRRMAQPALAEGPSTFAGAYLDDDGRPEEPMFDYLSSLGAIRPCDEWGAGACPDHPLTTDEAAVWVRVLFGLQPPVPLPELSEVQLGGALLCDEARCTPPPATCEEAAAIINWASVHRALPSPLDEEPLPYWNRDVGALLGNVPRLEGAVAACAGVATRVDQPITRGALLRLVGRAMGSLSECDWDACTRFRIDPAPPNPLD